MKYKVVVSDLDGTLLNSNHEISAYTKETIREIIEKKGIKFIIATGRHFIDASCFMKQLGAESYLISSNGTNAHNEKGEILVEHIMDEKIVKELLNLKVEEDISVNIFTNDGWYVEKYFSEFEKYHKESGFSPNVVDFKNFNKKDVLKFCFIADDVKKIEKLENQIRKNPILKGEITITASLDICLEIMKNDVSKGKTLKEILDRGGFKLSETIAFGDGLNDEEMLSIVGKGLIMGNGSDKLKRALPNNEVILTTDEDGEAKYLRKIFLGE
ncbi:MULTISPECIES: Cof-type HAD-IIB family hydrolase [Fusobacterium]|uniref:Cof-type HAD-IIB family hydrolase n=1 Tax=Fusobacterium TaxID=848 RepID=UPI0014772023|nr:MULTISPECIES: Cof-type HAD-IIB family hydrolase [Fusobacterium]NME35740.1 HAD family phosphatase [Fusobacterium sp. FSA-380-WT-3A]